MVVTSGVAGAVYDRSAEPLPVVNCNPGIVRGDVSVIAALLVAVMVKCCVPGWNARKLAVVPLVMLGGAGDGITCARKPWLLPSVYGKLRPTHDIDRKSTRLNSSHLGISYAVFCLKKGRGRTPGQRGHRAAPPGGGGPFFILFV